MRNSIISKQKTITLPAGSRSYVVVVAMESAEYPEWTSQPGEGYDDVAEWSIIPAGGTAITGSARVNSLHGAFAQSAQAGTLMLGLFPYAVVATGIIKENASGPTTVQIQVGAKNVKDGLLPTTVVAALLPVDIEPDANTAGVIGDVVKSAKAGSTIKHVVTPKAATGGVGPPEPINQPYVVLKASGITTDQITPGNAIQIVEWDGGEAVPNEPLKRRVKRDATGTGPTEVKIKLKPGGSVAVQMNVWVVWANCTPKVSVAECFQHPLPQIGDRARWEVDRSPNKDDPTKLWKFTFKIEPAKIFTDEEKPKVEGGSERPVPGNGKKHAVSPAVEADSALKKWDVSRQWKATIRNPGGISKANLTQSIGAELAKNQPVGVDSPVIFPTDKAEGNDDPPGSDEDDNPYAENSSALLSHAIGEVTSFDGPRLSVLNSWGATAQSYSCEFNLDEFVRVELWDGTRATDRFWFRISDTTQGKWHHYLGATYSAADEEWHDNQSSSGTGHPKP